MKQKMLKIFWVLSVVFCIQTKEIDDLRSSKFQKELVHASECGNTKEVKHILDNYVIYNGAYDLEYYSTCNIALSEASRTYHTEIIKLLLVAGADADIKDNCGCTTLIWAVEKGHTKIAKLFITSGADVNAKANDGWTALNEAEIKRYPKVIKMLIEHGAVSEELFYSPSLKEILK